MIDLTTPNIIQLNMCKYYTRTAISENKFLNYINESKFLKSFSPEEIYSNEFKRKKNVEL